MEGIDDYLTAVPFSGFVAPQAIGAFSPERKRSVAADILDNAADGSPRDIFFSRLFFEFMARQDFPFKKAEWNVLKFGEGAAESGITPYGPCDNPSELEIDAKGNVALNGEPAPDVPNPFRAMGAPLKAKIRQSALEPSIYKANFISYFNISILDACGMSAKGKKLGWKASKAMLPEDPLFAIASISDDKAIGGIERDGTLYPNPSLMWNEQFSLGVAERSKGAEKMRNSARYDVIHDASSFIKNFIALGGKCGQANEARRAKYSLMSKDVILGKEVAEAVVPAMKKGMDYSVKDGMTVSKLGTLVSALARDSDEGKVTLRYGDLSGKMAASGGKAAREAVVDTDLFLLGDIDLAFYRESNNITVNVSLSRMTSDDYFLNMPYTYRVERMRDRIVLMVE
jgi:hypothetical protein